MQFKPVVLFRKDSEIKLRQSILDNCIVIFYSYLLDDDLIIELNRLNPISFIHCAWYGVDSKHRMDEMQVTYNISFTLDTIKLCKQISCKNWIGIGSQAEYGIQNTILFEDKTIPNPITTYGKAKLATYWAANGLCNLYGISMKWCRVISTYGPYDHPNCLIPYVINNIYNNSQIQLSSCEQKWDYLFVNDAAQAIIGLSNSPSEGIFNIGSGHSIPLKDVVLMIKDKIDKNYVIQFGKKMKTGNELTYLEANIDKLKLATNWQPTTSIELGIDITIDHYKNNF